MWGVQSLTDALALLASLSLTCACTGGAPPAALGDAGAPPAAGEAATRPKLLVVLVIDQFRADYLSRFAPYFGDKGFKRLARRGVLAILLVPVFYVVVRRLSGRRPKALAPLTSSAGGEAHGQAEA